MIRNGHIKIWRKCRTTTSVGRADVKPVDESEFVISAFFSCSDKRHDPVEIRSERA
jgi:hypothetical protein